MKRYILSRKISRIFSSNWNDMNHTIFVKLNFDIFQAYSVKMIWYEILDFLGFRQISEISSLASIWYFHDFCAFNEWSNLRDQKILSRHKRLASTQLNYDARSNCEKEKWSTPKFIVFYENIDALFCVHLFPDNGIGWRIYDAFSIFINFSLWKRCVKSFKGGVKNARQLCVNFSTQLQITWSEYFLCASIWFSWCAKMQLG